MIKAVRLVLHGNLSYENVSILPLEEQGHLGLPDLFEDSQIVFTCKDGKYILPDYQIILIHLKTGRTRVPDGSFKTVRIRLQENITHEASSIVPKSEWASLGVPQVFRNFEQFVFVNKEGIFITTDYNVRDVRFK
tara:strand:+ start:12702 stop:13106 length:405 start_codon:yes stop_codon:yes gene_type:complete